MLINELFFQSLTYSPLRKPLRKNRKFVNVNQRKRKTVRPPNSVAVTISLRQPKDHSLKVVQHLTLALKPNTAAVPTEFLQLQDPSSKIVQMSIVTRLCLVVAKMALHQPRVTTSKAARNLAIKQSESSLFNYALFFFFTRFLM